MNNIILGGASVISFSLTLFHLNHVLKSERPKRKQTIHISIGDKKSE